MLYIYKCICAHVYIYIYIASYNHASDTFMFHRPPFSLCLSFYIALYTYTYADMEMYIYIYIYTHAYIYAYVYACIYMYISICIYCSSPDEGPLVQSIDVHSNGITRDIEFERHDFFVSHETKEHLQNHEWGTNKIWKRIIRIFREHLARSYRSQATRSAMVQNLATGPIRSRIWAIKRLRKRSTAVRHWRDFSLKRLRTRSCHEWESLVSKFRS